MSSEAVDAFQDRAKQAAKDPDHESHDKTQGDLHESAQQVASEHGGAQAEGTGMKQASDEHHDLSNMKDDNPDKHDRVTGTLSSSS